MRLRWTQEVQDFLGSSGFSKHSEGYDPNVVAVWLNSDTYMAFHMPAGNKSHKFQPLVTLKQLQILMLMPTGEARLEWCKANIRRKWD